MFSYLKDPKGCLLGTLIVLAGIVAGQACLYGPCLTGNKILLPLDTLARHGIYIPRTPEITSIQEQDDKISDLVYLREPARRFIAKEFRSGRLPLWWPN